MPDRSRVLMRPFYPTSDDIARRIVARVMALPDEEVARLLGRVLGEFADRHEHVEKIFPQPLRAGASLPGRGVGAFAGTAGAHRRLLHARILPGIRGAVQSFHRAAPRPERAAQGRAPFHPEPAGHGRRAHFLHHLPHGHRQRAASHHAHAARAVCDGAGARAQRRLREGALLPQTPGSGRAK